MKLTGITFDIPAQSKKKQILITRKQVNWMFENLDKDTTGYIVITKPIWAK